MSQSEHNISVEYKGFNIRYLEDENMWEAWDALNEKVKSNSLKGIKGILRKTSRKQFDPVKCLHQEGDEEGSHFEVVEVTAINNRDSAFFTTSAGRNNNDSVSRNWYNRDKPVYNFFKNIPENIDLMRQINARQKTKKEMDKEIQALEKKFIPEKFEKYIKKDE